MAHVDLHKINELLQKIQHEDSSDLAQAKATGKDHKLRSGRYHDMAQQDTEGMSDGDMVDVIANLYYRLDKLHALESINEINPSRSPWTQSGKHPGAMNREELEKEIAVFDELRARGDHLSPKELAQEDSLYHYLDQTSEDETPNFNPKGGSFAKRADAARGMWASSNEIQKRFKTWQDFMNSEDFDDWLDDKFRDELGEDSGCPCCGCDSVAECTCSPDCPNCDCHSGVTEDDRYTKYASVPGREYDKDDKAEAKLLSLQDRKSKLLKKLDRISDEGGKIGINDPEYKELQAVKKAIAGLKEDEASDLYHDNVKSGKDYNDYKGIQIHNLRKELKQVRKTLLNLQDIEGKDNSSDMLNNIKGMLGGYEQVVDNMEDAFNKLRIGRHRKESSEFQKRVKEAEQGSTEYYRELDKNQLDHTHQLLMKAMNQLNVAIAQRSKFGKELMGSGDRAGTGHLYGILQRLEAISNEWDRETELYGN
jgi:hypothetical protein